MWWIWLVPSLAVAAALLVTAAVGNDVWRKVKRLRARVGELSGDTERAQQALAEVSTAAEALATRMSES